MKLGHRDDPGPPAAVRVARSMGIRFLCPNGHKLNVKQFQAGQRGICPFCGVKIVVPAESTLPNLPEKHAEHHADADLVLDSNAATAETSGDDAETSGIAVAAPPQPDGDELVSPLEEPVSSSVDEAMPQVTNSSPVPLYSAPLEIEAIAPARARSLGRGGRHGVVRSPAIRWPIWPSQQRNHAAHGSTRAA